jgi:hypothetical protein
VSTVTEALAGLKAAFLTITPPAGVDLNNRVWAWPADRASVSYATFPFILCSQVLNENGLWRPASQGVGFHNWPAEVLICLSRETQRDDVSAELEEDAQAWLYAAAAVVFDNRGLGGAAFDLGTPESLLTTQIGNMGWLGETTVFWGVYVRVMVHQEHSLPSI